MEGIRNLMPKNERRIFDKFLVLIRESDWAAEDMNDALIKRFGPEARFPLSDMATSSLVRSMSFDKAKKIEIISSTVVNENEVTLKLRETRTINPITGGTVTEEGTRRAVKERSGWKIADPDPVGDESHLDLFRKTIEVHKTVTANVKDGKYAASKDALRELATLLKAHKPRTHSEQPKK